MKTSVERLSEVLWKPFAISFHNLFAKIISSHLNTPTNNFIFHINLSLCLTNHLTTISFCQGSWITLYSRSCNFTFKLLNYQHPRVSWFILVVQTTKHYTLISTHKSTSSPRSSVHSWWPLTLYVHIKVSLFKRSN